jgi:hypothetical protein
MKPVSEGCLDQQQNGAAAVAVGVIATSVAQWRGSKTAHGNALALFNQHAAEAQVGPARRDHRRVAARRPRPDRGRVRPRAVLPWRRLCRGIHRVITRCCLTSASASSPRRPTASSGVRVAFPHRHLRRGEVVGRQPPMARCGVPAASGKRLAVGERRVSLLLRDPVGPMSGHLPAEANVLSFSLSAAGEMDPSLVVKKPGRGGQHRQGDDAPCSIGAARSGPAAAPTFS